MQCHPCSIDERPTDCQRTAGVVHGLGELESPRRQALHAEEEQIAPHNDEKVQLFPNTKSTCQIRRRGKLSRHSSTQRAFRPLTTSPQSVRMNAGINRSSSISMICTSNKTARKQVQRRPFVRFQPGTINTLLLRFFFFFFNYPADGEK